MLPNEIRRLEAAVTAGDTLVREILEALCRRDGLPLESSVNPGEPARNYELAIRLGIGRVFGCEPEVAVADPSSAGTVQDSPAPEGPLRLDSGPVHKPGPRRIVGRRLTQDCWGCRQPWPCDGSWQRWAEAAEAKLAEIESHCREHPEHTRLYGSGSTIPVRVRADVILAVIGTEGDGRG